METALITGASSGIGFELAKIMAAKGHDLILTARSKEKLDILAHELFSKYGRKITVIDTDLSDVQNCKKVFDEIDERKIHVDILINNAGFGDYGFFHQTDWQKEYDMIELNISSLTFLTKLFVKEMIKYKSGRIMNVASTAAFQPGPKMAVYYATKAYVLSFSQAIANELKGYNITVTALCPGPTRSGFQSAANLDHSKLFHSKRIPTSEEVAEYGYEKMMKGKQVAIPGTMNKAGVIGAKLLPRKLVTKVARLIQDSKK